MRQPITFFVSGEPKPQPRPRARAFAGHAQMYNPKTADAWKTAVREKWERMRKCDMNFWRFDTAVSMVLEFNFTRPKTHFGAKGLKPSSPKHHVSRIDLDNLAKSTLDALKDCGAILDDGLVISLRISKQWAEANGCCITIREEL